MSGERIAAVKNVSANEQFFAGHFPGRPVMPGVLILEALAQTAGILCFVTAGIYPDETVRFYFAGIDQVRFRRPVVPGDQLLLKATLTRRIRTIWKFDFAPRPVMRADAAASSSAVVTPGAIRPRAASSAAAVMSPGSTIARSWAGDL